MWRCVLLQVQQLSKLEVEDLLKKGAYGALMDEEDEGSKFCEEDIDQILQRRTQTITIQTEGKGSTFAKVGAQRQETLQTWNICINIRHIFFFFCLLLRPVSSRLVTGRTFLWTTPTSGRSGPRSQKWSSTPSQRR